jgi:tRNA (adenine37-N6)-methyltransferase
VARYNSETMAPELYSVTPIGVVRNNISQPIDDIWGDMISRIDLDTAQFSAEALAGLDEFSHVEILFHFNWVTAAEVQSGARHPRGRKDWPKVGIFAQRGKARPNRIGVTVCKLLCVERATITVEGLDAIDGTPVLDIKPYMHQFAPRGNVRQPRWADELMSRYWSSSQEHE